MTNQLTNGDYAVLGTGLVRLQGSAADFHNALYRLQCRRGSFPFLPTLGSRLWRLGLVRPGDRENAARQYCVEALQGCGVQARNIRVTEQGSALCVEAELVEGTSSVHVEVSL